MASLYIVRGVPGAGKTTLGNSFKACGLVRFVISADDYMVDINGMYNFDPARLRDCHEKCRGAVETALRSGDNVAVCNTFTRVWEFLPYVEIAKNAGCLLYVIRCEGMFQNVHGVPDDVVSNMRDRFENWHGSVT